MSCARRNVRADWRVKRTGGIRLRKVGRSHASEMFGKRGYHQCGEFHLECFDAHLTLSFAIFAIYLQDQCNLELTPHVTSTEPNLFARHDIPPYGGNDSTSTSVLEKLILYVPGVAKEDS